MRATVLAAAAALAASGSAWPTAAGAEEAIAFVAPSRQNSEIRLVDPDGGHPRTLFRVPAGTRPAEGVDTLAWSPDGRRLAFASGHAWRLSTNIQDVYVVTRDGAVTRPTSPPDPGDYGKYPKGKVHIQVSNPGYLGAEAQVFVQGARKPVDTVLRQETWNDVVVDDVADFGPGVRQYVRVFNSAATIGNRSACWLDAGGFADVEPGKTADAGKLSSFNEVECARVFSPTWIDDATLAFLLIEPTAQIGQPTSVWSGTADSGPTDFAQPILRIDDMDVSNYLYAVAAGPKSAAPQLALVRRGGMSGEVSGIFVGPLSDLGQLRRVGPACQYGSACSVLGLAWRPDEQAVFYSEYLEPAGAAAVGELHELGSADRTILSLPGEVIGRIAVSPDGRTIAFERAARLEDATPATVRTGDLAHCPCSIWLVDADGGNLRRLVEDGRAPAWGR